MSSNQPTHRSLNIRVEDYEFYEEFAKKLSARVGFEVRIQQALKMAVTKYKVKNGLTEEVK